MSHVEDLTQLVLRERQARDHGWWDWMAESYLPDSTASLAWFRGSGPDFVERSREMHRRGVQTAHRVCAPAVHVRGDRAFAEAGTSVEVRTALDGVRADLVSRARLNYRFLRRGGEWGILSLHAIYERDSLTPVVPGQAVPVPPESIEHRRPSYALLAHVLERWGVPVGDDNLGDDRPAEVDAFYLGVLSWLES